MSKPRLQSIFILTLVISSFLLSSCGGHKKTTSSNFYTIYSKKLGVKLTGKENKKLIKTLASWKGTPYRYGGRKRSGSDCSGFVGAVYVEVYKKYLHRSSRDMLKDVRTIRKSKLKAGDLVFFKTSGRRVSHVGIYVADNKFMHAASTGVIVSDLKEKYYKRTYYKSGKVK